MAEKLNASHMRPKDPTLSNDLDILRPYEEAYRREKERIRLEKRGWLDTLKEGINRIFTSEKPIEKKEDISYDEYALSHIAKKHLDTNASRLIQENPDTSCIIAYAPGGAGQKGKAVQLCIPRSNPKDAPIQASGFTLTPVPKSNGYNTEYTIRDTSGKSWTQLAILFPAENPKYLKKEALKNEQVALKKEIATAEGVLSKIPKKKKKEKELVVEKIHALQLRSAQLRERILASGSPERYTHITYIPYREGLNTLDNRKQGFDYLASSMRGTYSHPIASKTLGGLPSNAPGLSITQAIPWQYPTILNIIERMDYELYFDSTGKTMKPKEAIEPIMDKQISRSLTTFGVNTTQAFNWQKSKVGAQGVGQIMPETYARFHNPIATKKNPSPERKYVSLFPEDDFDLAARDHETSFRLQIAHFDNQIFQFPSGIKKNWKGLIDNPNTGIGIIALLAAGYNGSMSRIMTEVFGEDYKKNPLTLPEYEKKLTVENIKTAMDRAKNSSIYEIQSENKSRKEYNKKTKKTTILPPLPLNAEQIGRIKDINSRYKESMTYVVKAEYVWRYLKKTYPSGF